MSETWYPPGGHDPAPAYPTVPIIPVVDLASPHLRLKRRRFWKKALARALVQWQPTGLTFPTTQSDVGYAGGAITVDVTETQDRTAGQADFGRTPPDAFGAQIACDGCAWVHVDVDFFEGQFKARVMAPLTRVIAHEVGHTLGFAHGGTGVMQPSVDLLDPVNAEEIAAAKEYYFE